PGEFLRQLCKPGGILRRRHTRSKRSGSSQGPNGQGQLTNRNDLVGGDLGASQGILGRTHATINPARGRLPPAHWPNTIESTRAFAVAKSGVPLFLAPTNAGNRIANCNLLGTREVDTGL